MADAPVSKAGVLETLKKKKLSANKWKPVHVIISEGGLFVFEDMDATPAKTISIEDCVIDKTPETAGKPKEVCWGVRTPDSYVIFAAKDEEVATAWQNAIRTSKGKKLPPDSPKRVLDPSSPLAQHKGSLILRAKKNISGKVATSGLVKQNVMNEEVRELLNALNKVVAIVTDPKTAAEVEKQIIKMIVKAYFQMEMNNITIEDVRPIDSILRKAFNQVDKLFGVYQVRPISQLTEGLQTTASYLQEAAAAVLKVLEPRVQEKNIVKFREALYLVADSNFLIKVWDCPQVEQELFSLVSAMNKYTMIELPS